MRILKYELEITDYQRILLGNQYAEPLSVAEQNGKLMLWAMVYDGSISEEWAIDVKIIGTGNRAEEDVGPKGFIGTVVMSHGLVWHVFADIRRNKSALRKRNGF